MASTHCGRCGYDIRAHHRDDHCPECGWLIRHAAQYVSGRSQLKRVIGNLTLIIIAAIPLLIAMSFIRPVFVSPSYPKSRIAAMEVRSLAQQVSIWLADHADRTPAEFLSLNQLVVDDYLRTKDTVDPWNRPYTVQHTKAGDLQLSTLGADGLADGRDEDADITVMVTSLPQSPASRTW